MQRVGSIEVIVGGMFSGKTEELIRRIRRAQLARQKVQVFKPQFDTRYSDEDVISHDKKVMPAIPCKDATEILANLSQSTEVVGIDEAQFFDDEIIKLAQRLADSGRRVIVAGLDTDWKAQPFGPMPALMAVAENVTKQHAICMVCGATASRTQRIAAGDSTVELGAADVYEARCREHFAPEVASPTLDFNAYV